MKQNRFKFYIFFSAMVIATMVLAACVPATPSARIQNLVQGVHSHVINAKTDSN